MGWYNNKELCKKCVNQAVSYSWTEDDERNWRLNRVHCPWIFRDLDSPLLVSNDIDSIPSKCPYRLEHIVTQMR